MSWRDQIRVHPAADLFPMMTEAELDELAADIAKNGLWQVPVWFREAKGEPSLLDGRNRIAAIDRIGDPALRDQLRRVVVEQGDVLAMDPYAYVVSANIRRRHLTAEQKRELIGKLLKENPGRSDRATAKIATVDHKTVAAVRAEAERRGEIPHATARTDSAGRSQPARKGREIPIRFPRGVIMDVTTRPMFPDGVPKLNSVPLPLPAAAQPDPTYKPDPVLAARLQARLGNLFETVAKKLPGKADLLTALADIEGDIVRLGILPPSERTTNPGAYAQELLGRRGKGVWRPSGGGMTEDR